MMHKMHPSWSGVNYADAGFGEFHQIPSAQGIPSRLRKGKWTKEEEAYTEKLISAFRSGHLRLSKGATLRSFLSSKLQCDPMRISKKFAGSVCVGRQIYHPSEPTEENLKKIEQVEAEVQQSEALFKARAGSEVREDASSIPGSLNKSWGFQNSYEAMARQQQQYYYGGYNEPMYMPNNVGMQQMAYPMGNQMMGGNIQGGGMYMNMNAMESMNMNGYPSMMNANAIDYSAMESINRHNNYELQQLDSCNSSSLQQENLILPKEIIQNNKHIKVESEQTQVTSQKRPRPRDGSEESDLLINFFKAANDRDSAETSDASSNSTSMEKLDNNSGNSGEEKSSDSSNHGGNSGSDGDNSSQEEESSGAQDKSESSSQDEHRSRVNRTRPVTSSTDSSHHEQSVPVSTMPMTSMRVQYPHSRRHQSSGISMPSLQQMPMQEAQHMTSYGTYPHNQSPHYAAAQQQQQQQSYASPRMSQYPPLSMSMPPYGVTQEQMIAMNAHQQAAVWRKPMIMQQRPRAVNPSSYGTTSVPVVVDTTNGPMYVWHEMNNVGVLVERMAPVGYPTPSPSPMSYPVQSSSMHSISSSDSSGHTTTSDCDLPKRQLNKIGMAPTDIDVKYYDQYPAMKKIKNEQ